MANEHIVLCNEIIVDSTNDTVNFKESGTSRTATLTHGTFFLYGNGSETGDASDGTSNGDFGANLTAAMTAAALVANYTCETYFWTDSTHIATQFQVLTNTGTIQIVTGGTFDLTLLGFSTNTAIASVINSDISASASWVCDQPYVSILNLTRDHSYSQRFSSGGKPYSYALKDQSLDLELLFNNVSKRRAIYSNTTSNETDSFEMFYNTLRKGGYARAYVVEIDGVAYSTDSSSLRIQGVLNLDKTDDFNPAFVQNTTLLYDFGITIREVVAL